VHGIKHTLKIQFFSSNKIQVGVIIIIYIVVKCSKPRKLKNGEVITSGNTPGETAAYSCNAPMILKGNTTRTCTTHGYWDGKTPKCGNV